MKRILGIMIASAFLFGPASAVTAAETQKAMDKGEKSGGAAKGIKGMSKEELINTALSAAPAYISKDAAVLIPGEDGRLMEVKKGTNGFTCIPDIDGQEIPDPFCGDEAASSWLMDAMAQKEKPSNTVPGVAYMAKGGWHWEKDGQIVMDKNTPGAVRVKEPPHWMVFWPFDSKTTGLPSKPGRFGTYIMYEDTSYSHLMIYQDPKGLK